LPRGTRFRARRFGVPDELIGYLVADVNTSPIQDKLKPVFAYLRKLTLTPTRMTQGDADAVYAAGWDERALYDAVLVCCLYNFMNRFVEGSD
jgi:alkylhydroperoxidase family enzyme